MRHLIYVLLLIPSLAFGQGTKISALPDGTPAQSSDAIAIARSGSNFRISVQDIRAAIALSAITGMASNCNTWLGTSTSANLAACLTNETGTGVAVFNDSPTIITPTIASFANANHNHSNSAGGGQVAIGSGISGLGTGVATWLGTPSSANLASAVTGETGSGALMFGTGPTASDPVFTGSINIPNGTAPTTDAAGEIAFDTNIWGASRGTVQIFDGTANTYAVNVLASDTPSNGQVPVWNTGGTITWEANGSGGSGCTTSGSAGEVLTDDGAGGCTSNTGLTYDGTDLTVTGGDVIADNLIPAGTLTDGYLCSYSSAGPTMPCNTNPAGFQTADADLTSWAGVTRASGFDTFTATPSSANLASLVTNETGSGLLVFATSPTLTTPNIGTPSAGDTVNLTMNVGNSDTTLTRSAAGVLAVEGVVSTRTIASGTVVINPGSVSSGACSSGIDGGTATGVASTDVISWSFNGDPTGQTGYNPSGDLIYIVAYPGTDAVTWKVCNKSGSSVTPTSRTLNWKVFR